MKEVSLASRYDAQPIESKWYARWEEAGLFSPDPDPSKPAFSITIPPPNITGSLHMGHALCYPLQDAIGRYKRLQGYSVLILPGQDHAGIATQSVVEKQLRKEGTSGVQIGREEFVKRVWEWRELSGNTILQQFRYLGCAFDWSRSRFTLDPEYADAVLDVFIGWFDRGLIFRGKRVVTWDPALQTSLSDMETERVIRKGKLYYLRYPFTDGSGYFVVATTRPETIFADVAIAVHPSDARYTHLVGKTVRIPIANREIPIIADIFPDPQFGTGALKITPAHDAKDFAVGQRHNLPMPVCLDQKAKLNELAGEFEGMDRFKARDAVVAKLEELGLLEKAEDHEISMAVSERSGEPVEPLLSEQWFVDQPQLAKPVIEAMERREIEFTPARYERIFIEWLTGIREWCISRQLWWGHRIPIFYAEDGTFTAAKSAKEADVKLGKPIVRQDDDVLDTWFSSGLWPFATMGWPQKTEDLARFYPTDLLVTDRNIINLWVSRMAMMGLDQVGEKPFKKVMIYATVLNERGQRMSKSLGTGVDPMVVIEPLGADVLRWTLQSQTGDNQDIRYTDKKTEDSRNFCNKIWNASRFILMNLGDTVPKRPNNSEFEPIDLWILSRLDSTLKAVKEAYESLDFITITQNLQKFFWDDFCDWYIEAVKSKLQGESDRSAVAQWTLLTCLESFLIALHPVMPHISEEIYSQLPAIRGEKKEFIMSEKWSILDVSFHNEAIQVEFDHILDIIRELRSLRAIIGVSAMRVLPNAYYDGDLGGHEELIASQGWFTSVTRGRPAEKVISGFSGSVELFIPISGLVDGEKELTNIAREELKLQKELIETLKRLDNPQFLERAKPEAVEKEKAGADHIQKRLATLDERRKLFSEV